MGITFAIKLTSSHESLGKVPLKMFALCVFAHFCGVTRGTPTGFQQPPKGRLQLRFSPLFSMVPEGTKGRGSETENQWNPLLSSLFVPLCSTAGLEEGPANLPSLFPDPFLNRSFFSGLALLLGCRSPLV